MRLPPPPAGYGYVPWKVVHGASVDQAAFEATSRSAMSSSERVANGAVMGAADPPRAQALLIGGGAYACGGGDDAMGGAAGGGGAVGWCSVEARTKPRNGETI